MYKKVHSRRRCSLALSCSYQSRSVLNLNIVKRVCIGVFHCTSSFCILVISPLFRAFSPVISRLFFSCHFERSEAKSRNPIPRKGKRCFDYVLTDSAQHDNAVVFSFLSFRAYSFLVISTGAKRSGEIQTYKKAFP